MNRFLITDRRCGLGDSLLNLAATWYLAKRYKRDVIIDWRRLPYTIKNTENWQRHQVNLFHSLFSSLPDQLEGVNFLFPEQFSEIYFGPKTEEGYPFDLDHISPIDHAESQLDALERKTDKKETISLLESKEVFVRNSMRMGESNKIFPELEEDIFLLKISQSDFNFWNFLTSLPVCAPVEEKIKNFYPQKFGSHTAAVHFRNGNGEKTTHRDLGQYELQSATILIREEAEKLLGSDFNKFNFFVCTDSPTGEKLLKERLPNAFSFPKVVPAKGDGPIHFNTRLSPISSIQESFIDMMLMSKCSHIIYTKSSTFSIPALFNIKRENQLPLFRP
jgi:hypothetical protein